MGRGAHEEVARAKRVEGLDIELVTVESLRDGSHSLVKGETTLFGAAPDLEPRATDTLPSVEELMGTEIDEELARAAEKPETHGSN